MALAMVVFGKNKTKPSNFEKWLSENGYYYMKTKDSRPCFKSKLTRKLKQKYQTETQCSKSNIFSFKFAR